MNSDYHNLLSKIPSLHKTIVSWRGGGNALSPVLHVSVWWGGLLEGLGYRKSQCLSLPEVKDPDGDRLSYVWSFGDGESAKDVQAIKHTYTKAGSYKVTVSVSDGRGGLDSATQTITVTGSTTEPIPDPAPDPNPDPETPEPDPIQPDPVPGKGTLKLDVTPNGSSWTVGTLKGTGDKTISLPAGDYTLSVNPPAKSPFVAATQSISIAQGQTIPLSVSLEPIAGVRFNVEINYDIEDYEEVLHPGERLSVSVWGTKPYTNPTELGFQQFNLTGQETPLQISFVKAEGDENGWAFYYDTSYPTSYLGGYDYLEATATSPFELDWKNQRKDVSFYP